jgi:hypothetical protein
VHINADQTFNVVPLNQAPVRLACNAFLDDDCLYFTHNNPTLIGICQRVGLC